MNVLKESVHSDFFTSVANAKHLSQIKLYRKKVGGSRFPKVLRQSRKVAWGFGVSRHKATLLEEKQPKHPLEVTYSGPSVMAPDWDVTISRNGGVILQWSSQHSQDSYPPPSALRGT